MYNLNGFAFKYEANLHPFQTYLSVWVTKFTNNKKVLYNSAQGLSHRKINEIERNKTTINKFCKLFNQ